MNFWKKCVSCHRNSLVYLRILVDLTRNARAVQVVFFLRLTFRGAQNSLSNFSRDPPGGSHEKGHEFCLSLPFLSLHSTVDFEVRSPLQPITTPQSANGGPFLAKSSLAHSMWGAGKESLCVWGNLFSKSTVEPYIGRYS